MLQEVLSGIFSFQNLLMMNIGLAAGIIIGALPGLNVIFAITVLMPLTFDMPSTAGMMLMLGAYCGAMYGGSITAILINTPGTPAAVATTFDGYPLAKKGRAGDALKAALVGSTIGGLISALLLLTLAPTIAKLILNVGSPEYFSLCIFGIFAAIGIAGDGTITKGVIGALIGLFLSTVGMDAFEGTARYTFGEPKLLAGLKEAVIMLGTYALSEVLLKSREIYVGMYKPVPKVTFQKATIKIWDILKYKATLIKSSLIGTVIGAIPGTGGNPWVYIIMGGLVVINLFMLFQGSVFIKAFANVTRVPLSIIMPIVAILCTMGTFAIGNSYFDIRIMLIFGLVGFLMKRFKFPIPPLTIGLVLGKLMESNLRRSLLLSDGSFSIFFTRPFSLVILIIAFASLFYPMIRSALAKGKAAK